MYSTQPELVDYGSGIPYYPNQETKTPPPFEKRGSTAGSTIIGKRVYTDYVRAGWFDFTLRVLIPSITSPIILAWCVFFTLPDPAPLTRARQRVVCHHLLPVGTGRSELFRNICAEVSSVHHGALPFAMLGVRQKLSGWHPPVHLHGRGHREHPLPRQRHKS